MTDELDDLKEFPRDMYLRGDASTQIALTIGRQGRVGVDPDVVVLNVPEEYAEIDGKRLSTLEISTVADIASISTRNLNNRVVRVLGGTTIGDGLGGDYYYRSTGKSGVTVDGYKLIAGPGADDYLERLSGINGNSVSVANVAALPSSPQGSSHYVQTNRLTYSYRGAAWVTDGYSTVDTDAQWGAMTEMVDDQIVRHKAREAFYIYNSSSTTWSWAGGNQTHSNDDSIPTVSNSTRLFHGLDSRLGGEFVRTVDGTTRLVDQSRNGTPRPLEPGRSYKFEASADYIELPKASGEFDFSTDSFSFSCVTKATSAVSNFLFSNATSDTTYGWYIRLSTLSVVANVGTGPVKARITYVADFSVWRVITITWNAGTQTLKLYVDGTEQGSVTQAIISGSSDSSIGLTFGALRSSSSTFVPYGGYAFGLRLFSRLITTTEITAIANHKGPTDTSIYLKCDESSGTTSYDSSGNGNDGTIVATTISTFHDSSANGQYSFQNEVGYTLSGSVYVPRDELNTSRDVQGNALQYTGQASHDPIISSPCGTFDGTGDVITYGDTGLLVTSLSMWIKQEVDNQQILTLQDSTATAITVVAGVLTFGGSLSVSEIKVDSVVLTASGAGALLNDNSWHLLELALTSISGSSVKLGTDSSAFGNFQLADFNINNTELSSAICAGSGTTIYDTSGNSKNGTLTTASASAFWNNNQNKTETLVKNGYRRTGSVNIPMLLDGSNAADGGAKTHGPGTLAPGQSLDLTCGEGNSPLGQSINSLLTSTTYAQGDGNNSSTLFVNTTTNGDSRLQIFNSVLTGSDLNKLNKDVS